jgi:calcineurin-like phosphoesterase family protein
LIEVWNKQVRKGDFVYVLGDLSFAKLEHTREILSELNGQIAVLKGNHDRREVLNALVEMNLIQSWKDYKEVKPKDTSICLMHFPIASWHKQGYGSWMLHGHSHGTYKGTGRVLDVGLDSAYNLFGQHKLFSYEDVEKYMQGVEVSTLDCHRVQSEL